MKVRPLPAPYWRPGCDYALEVARLVKPYIRDGDVVVVSEKAVSTAKGSIADESCLCPRLTSRILAGFWMRVVWGYLLGVLCRFKPSTIRHLRAYPRIDGAKHKELVLRRAGLLHALKYGSEGGIDLSNLPYSYASLPLRQPSEEAKKIHKEIVTKTGKKPVVIISDTDSTFSFKSFHFTSRPNPIRGIHSFPGPLPFIAGRAMRLKERATPIAVAGASIPTEMALRIAERAHHARGYGSGRTVWEASKRHGARPSEVTWQMLEADRHYPVVLVRLR
ncbi:MAG: coenzyme F420-0:L-glutamate ligase [Candidatus Bathyarchaeia archaeon]